jgi:hypothetical protein
MSAYGLTRLLRSRELGPAQLLPSLHELGGGLGSLCAEVERGILALASESPLEAASPHTEIGRTLGELAALTRRVGGELGAAFEGVGKLSARERLALERTLERHGTALEAAYHALWVCDAARDPRPIVLTVDELLRGQWIAPPAFVSRRVEVWVANARSQRFVADPRLLWAIIERAVGQREGDGIAGMVLLTVAREASGQAVLRVDPAAGVAPVGERVILDLHPSLGLEDAVLDAAARTLGCTTSCDAETVRIALAAA